MNATPWWSLAWFARGGATGLALVVASAGLWMYAASQGPRQCSDGYAPATNRGIDSDCLRQDRPLPSGYRWDPGGNKVPG